MSEPFESVRATFPLSLLHPRHWASWLLVGAIRLLGLLPLPLLVGLGKAIGFALYPLGGSRRQVALINLKSCFPELTEAECSRMAREHFGYLTAAALAQGVCWSSSRQRLTRLLDIHGIDMLKEVKKSGQPFILLVPHFVALELASVAYSAAVEPGLYMYQRIRNPVFDWQVMRGRTRFGHVPLERHDDLRTLIRSLKQGIPFYYLPDQDPGKRRGVFAPFCGQQAATVGTLGRIARLAKAVVIPVFVRLATNGRRIELRFSSPIEGLTGTDPVADAGVMNQVIEAEVRRDPVQYFWVHRRFKTRPPGESPFYPRSARRRRRR
ncbi:lysophospholipid acyltransferase family protein [Thiorhodovibrio frisius]|uniref:Lauroyl/myristoyl acyltransferase n=1 Tax=Thiorhodovibrio frisius TaxID=631362 RepID=H8Z3L9_9GAMM|nr:lysophospholipid acyltransferase family protein [Thiorhodovibrio frisius]EIC20008.1 Lauroyl/myristoyl acyltransferase [Thiorhodovibrio frisius]WPL20737.1 Lipid A biosynthesis lauroyl acyltransferase [Thiorhodovibrio frisius]